jgi:hypothetical protein
MLSIYEQRKKGTTGQFHEPVVTDKGGKIPAELRADTALIVPFKTAIAA